MFKSLSHKFANLLINNEVIEKGDFEIYRYGFETLIYFIVNIFVALFIGIIFDKLIHTIVFLSCYCTLRQFTGGYHARNYTECTLTFAMIYIITIFSASSISIGKYKYLLIIMMVVNIIIIYRFAPLEHRNKPLNENEKSNYKVVAIKIATTIGLIFTFSIKLNIFIGYGIYSFFAISWICILLILGCYMNLDR